MSRKAPLTRSQIMSRIKCRGSKLEKEGARLLRAAGFGGFVEQFLVRLPSGRFRPDISWPERKVALYLDSCFWHYCPEHYRAPKSNAGYWGPKQERWKKRSAFSNESLREAGWIVVRVWGHDLEKVAEKLREKWRGPLPKGYNRNKGSENPNLSNRNQRKTTMELTHKDLQAAAKDINKVFGVSPQIKVITSRPNLEKSIRDAMAPFVAEADSRIEQLAESTVAAYNELAKPPAAPPAPPAPEPETVPASEEDCPAFGQDFDSGVPECTECARGEECEQLTRAAKAPKKSGKKAEAPAPVAQANDAQAEAAPPEPVAETAPPAAAAAVEEPKPPKEPKPAKGKLYSRNQAVCDAIREDGPLPFEALVDAAHARFTAQRGDASRYTTLRVADVIVAALLILGHVSKSGDGTLAYGQ